MLLLGSYASTFVPANHSNRSLPCSSFRDFDIARPECAGSVGSPRATGKYTGPKCQRTERTVAFAVVIIASTANASGAKPMTIANATATVQEVRLGSLLQCSGCLHHFLHHRLGRLVSRHAGTAGHGVQIGNIFIAVDFRLASRATDRGFQREPFCCIRLVVVTATATHSAIHHHQRRRGRWWRVCVLEGKRSAGSSVEASNTTMVNSAARCIRCCTASWDAAG